jgi:hypothetical protein
VGVVQAGQGFRFAPEAPPCRVVQGSWLQHLDGDVAIEVRVVGSVHLAHAASAEALDDSIVREGAADHFGGRGSDTSWNRPSMAVGFPCVGMLYSSHRASGTALNGGGSSF